MGEQKNLFLAIGLSIAIIIAFQFLFPQQAVVNKKTNQVRLMNKCSQLPLLMIHKTIEYLKIIKSKDEIINLSQTSRVIIDTPSLIRFN